MRGLWLLPALLAVSCNGTTGYDLVTFYASASGPADAVKDQPYVLEAAGERITIKAAKLHVGALYLTQSVPQSGGGPAPCVLPGTYDGVFVGEVRGGGDVDLLDPSAQPLQVTGDGSTIPARTGQVWLMRDDVNGDAQGTILTLEGSVEVGGKSESFSTGASGMTIDSDRISAMTNSALPGQYQLCRFRIVSGIPVNLTLGQSGTLRLRVDLRALLNGVTVSSLPACTDGTAAAHCFTNDESNTPSTYLFENLTTTAPYSFAWTP